MNRMREKCVELIYALQGGMVRDRANCARRYADIIGFSYLTGETEVADINELIIKRWSDSGLVYIKKMAWKMYESPAADNRTNK